MAASRAAKADGRTQAAKDQIRSDLGDGEFPEAIYTASAALLSALAKDRRWRPQETGLIHAEVAATLMALAERVNRKLPLEPEGWQKGDAVQPEHLLAVYDHVMTRANGGGRS